MSFLVQKLKSFILFFIGIFRRALCCFRRKRHPSCDSIPLTTIGVIPNNAAEFESWNSWEDTANSIKSDTFKPNSVQDHIEQYRHQKAMLARQKSESRETEQENFFEDMTPKITRQTKVYLNSDDNDNSRNVTSRLALNPQGIIPTVSIK